MNFFDEEPIRVCSNTPKNAQVRIIPNVNRTHYTVLGTLLGTMAGIVISCFISAIYIPILACTGLIVGFLVGFYKEKTSQPYTISLQEFGKKV